MDIPLSSVVKGQIRCRCWPSRQGLREMLFDLNNNSIVMNTIAAHILFSIYGHRFPGVKGTLGHVSREYHSLECEHILIKTYFSRRTLPFKKKLYLFTILYFKLNALFSHVYSKKCCKFFWNEALDWQISEKCYMHHPHICSQEINKQKLLLRETDISYKSQNYFNI